MRMGLLYLLGLIATFSPYTPTNALDEWRCDKVAAFFEYIYDYSLENPTYMKAIDDLEDDLGYTLDQPERRRDLACDIIEAAPSMHALSALGVPYFKIQHYYNLTQSIFDIEHDADWKTLLYKLQGEALLVETAHNFYEPHPGVEWTRVYAEDFARTMQTVFGSPRLKENYAYLSVFNANITPVEFADSYMEVQQREIPRGAPTYWEWLQTVYGLGEFVTNTRALRLALELDLMPLVDDGDVQIPTVPEECQVVFDFMRDYLRDETLDLPEYTANRLTVEYQLSRDLLDPDVLLEVACDLSDLEGLESLAQYLNVPLSRVETVRDRLLRTAEFRWENMTNLREIRQTMGRVVDFLFRTHFPDFPLENVGDVHQFVSDVRELEYEAKIYKVFPTNSMTDEELAEAIVSSLTLEQYMESIGLDLDAIDSIISPRERLKKFVKYSRYQSLEMDLFIRLFSIGETLGMIHFED